MIILTLKRLNRIALTEMAPCKLIKDFETLKYLPMIDSSVWQYCLIERV